MISFFKKILERKSTPDHLEGFRNKFSENQKIAILNSLYIIAYSDGEFHQTEAQFFNHIAKLLGYTNLRDKMDKFMSKGSSTIFQILNSLDENQKDWYIITAYALLHADGEALEIEFQYMEVYLEKMGISKERFHDVIKNSHSLINEIVSA